jgi:glyoxylase-like metal-dependent hydrolase (beta-lactamase superfamily II)
MQTSVQEVADNIYEFQVPLPFKLNEINLYLVKSDDGCVLIDTGTNTPATAAALQANLDEIGVCFADLRYVAITHFHSDHSGLAGWIQDHSDAEILMHADSQRFVGSWGDEDGEGPVDIAPDVFYQQHGLPQATLDVFRSMRQRWRTLTLPFSITRTVDDGDVVQVGGNDYHIVFTPGHAIGHICVFCPQLNLAFTGDHILQRITPNISIHSDRHPLHKNERYNPLSDFFLSLEKTRQLGFTLGLPSHGALLTDPAGRIDELLSHHTERLDVMLAAMSDGPETAYTISRYAFPKYDDPFSHWMMLGETLAHLELLESRQQVERVYENGHILFRQADAVLAQN